MRRSALSTICQTITVNNSYGIISLIDLIRDVLYTRVTINMEHKQIMLAGSSHKIRTFTIAVDRSNFAFPSVYFRPLSASGFTPSASSRKSFVFPIVMCPAHLEVVHQHQDQVDHHWLWIVHHQSDQVHPVV